MRLVFVVPFAMLIGCDHAGAEVKVACATDVQCPAGWGCVDAHCVPPEGTDGGGGSGGTCVPTGAEACNGVDDDCDGTTDPSSCPWYYGLPMPVVELHTGLGDHLHPHASRDGLRLYYGGFDPSGAATTVVAARASRHARFLAPGAEGAPFERPAIVEGLAPLGAPGAATFSADELEGFIQVRDPMHGQHFDIARRTRADAEGVFEDRGLVPGAARGGVDEIQPYVSRDGSELFFAANPLPSNRYRLYRIVRDENGEFSGDATELTLLGDAPAHADFSPYLADDGETLIYESIRRAGEGPVLMRAVRERERDPNVFTIAGPLPARVNVVLSGEPFFSESTGELFFVSTQPWSPASIALWRMRVCRDAPCPEEEPVPCPAGAETTMQSPDGRHCFGLLGARMGFDAARSACESAGGTLASIHSEREASLLGAMLGGGAFAWIGGFETGDGAFAWETGEPFLYAPWTPGNPTPVNGCVALAVGVDTALGEVDCSRALGAICEIASYPTW